VGVSADKIAAHNIPDAIANSQSHPDCIQTIPQRHLKVTHLVEQCRVQDHKGWVIIPSGNYVVFTMVLVVKSNSDSAREVSTPNGATLTT